MDWFERLTGFKEKNHKETHSLLEVRDGRLISKVNGQGYAIGQLELVSLAELRVRASQVSANGLLKVKNISGDVRQMHHAPEYAGALFQVASQFNLLEMIGPDVKPEDGVARYQHDATQGPACAIAAGAATIYRNYFVPVGDRVGQFGGCQVDALAGLGHGLRQKLADPGAKLWTMKNGYALPTRESLRAINAILTVASEPVLEDLRGLLRIGVHSDVEVTDGPQRPGPCVSQAFCSALPVSYSGIESAAWDPFASLVLEAAYEATLLAGILNAARGGSRKVLLTQLGGGAFGNETRWIHSAMLRALKAVRNHDLEVYFVSYGSPQPALVQLAKTFSLEAP